MKTSFYGLCWCLTYLLTTTLNGVDAQFKNSTANLTCNGAHDCHDHPEGLASGRQDSEKSPVNTPVMPAPINEGCVLEIRANMIAAYEYDPNSQIHNNAVVDSLHSISYKCRKGHVLFGQTENTCFNGTWLHPVPECSKICSSTILQGVTFEAKCQHEQKGVDCNSPIRPGTRAKISCAVGYREPERANIIDILFCEPSGEWDDYPTSCVPECGRETINATQFVSNVDPTNITSVPWHTAIYKLLGGAHDLVCGGSIIGAKLVITAAHCFGDSRNAKDYTIVVGKVHRNFYASESLGTQQLNVSEIIIPPSYLGPDSFYYYDIALLALDKFIKFQYHIKPICIQWRGYSEIEIPAGTIGKVAGWGRVEEDGDFSEDLKSIELSVIKKDVCIKKSLPGFKPFVNSEKFCAGNEEGEGAVCQGDSGGGFVVSRKVAGVPIYYLYGVLSTSLSTKTCGLDYYVIFTNIQHHREMVTEYLTRYNLVFLPLRPVMPAPINERCVLEISANMIAAYEYDPNYQIHNNAVVDSLHSISYKCRKGHVLFGQTENTCFNGTWLHPVPECSKICSSTILQGNTFEAKCQHEQKGVDCNSPIRPGTRAKISCAVGYREPERANIIDILVCEPSGEWDYYPTSCVPECGLETIITTPFVSNGDLTNITSVPWHTAIYKLLGGAPVFFCGGSIIGAKLVITAAHCFADSRNAKDYTIVVGKIYRNFHATEFLATQQAHVSEIIIPPSYLGPNGFYYYDIALLVLNKFIKYQYHIKPICIQWRGYSEIEIPTGTIGKVAGWGRVDKGGDYSEDLRSIELSVIKKDVCIKKSSPEYESFVNSEKFCVGHEEGEGAVCQGDSGGGFAVSRKVAGVPIYYLYGVLSTSLSGETCGLDYYVTFTNIQHHREMVTEYLTRYRPR